MFYRLGCPLSYYTLLTFNWQANLTISDITMKNFWGTVSDKYDPEAGTLVCSAADVSSA